MIWNRAYQWKARFADNTKLFRVIKTIRGCEELQMEWVSKWQISFKFKVMFVAAQNLNYSYKLMESELAATDNDKQFCMV